MSCNALSPPPPTHPLSPPLLEERWIISHRAAVRKTKENWTNWNYNYNGKNIRTNRSWSYEKYKKIRQSCDGDWASLKQDSDIVWLNWCDHAQLDTDWIRNYFLTLRNAQFLSFLFLFFNMFFYSRALIVWNKSALSLLITLPQLAI